ncbi:MAG: hypothetical protein ACRDI2_22470, partial [Chloroflexota bacterium]
MAQLQGEDVTGGVGEGDLVAPAVEVPQSQLGAGVGLLASADGARAGRPALDVDVELGDLASV